jgi:hypothetical protein
MSSCPGPTLPGAPDTLSRWGGSTAYQCARERGLQATCRGTRRQRGRTLGAFLEMLLAINESAAGAPGQGVPASEARASRVRPLRLWMTEEVFNGRASCRACCRACRPPSMTACKRDGVRRLGEAPRPPPALRPPRARSQHRPPGRRGPRGAGHERLGDQGAAIRP